MPSPTASNRSGTGPCHAHSMRCARNSGGINWGSGRPRILELEAPMAATHDRQIDYIEFGTTDVARTKQFYQAAFGWEFEDYGPDYTSFKDGRIAGGFEKRAKVVAGGPLVNHLGALLETARDAAVLEAGVI